MTDTSGAQALIDYQFNDIAPLWEALQAPGPDATTLSGRPLPRGNMRLALLGDSVLKTALLEGWYHTKESTGTLAFLPASLLADFAIEEGHNKASVATGNNHLANVGNHLGLGDFVNKNQSQGNVVPTRVMTATVEAIIGAVFLDSNHNFTIVRQVMQNIGLVDPETGA
ncbi:MAG: hypothetical protein Q9181_006263 [Wetmoreana brouardii]